MSYLLEKTYLAVEILSTGEGDVRSRLEEAYIHSLSRLNINHIPQEFKKDWEKYIGRLCSYEPVYYYFNGKKEFLIRTGLQEALYRMKNKTGSKIAAFIFRLFVFELERIKTNKNNLGKK